MTDIKVLKELKEIKSELAFIKKHMVDGDIILTSEDLESLEKAEKDFKEGKTKRLV